MPLTPDDHETDYAYLPPAEQAFVNRILAQDLPDTVRDRIEAEKDIRAMIPLIADVLGCEVRANMAQVHLGTFMLRVFPPWFDAEYRRDLLSMTIENAVVYAVRNVLPDSFDVGVDIEFVRPVLVSRFERGEVV